MFVTAGLSYPLRHAISGNTVAGHCPNSAAPPPSWPKVRLANIFSAYSPLRWGWLFLWIPPLDMLRVVHAHLAGADSMRLESLPRDRHISPTSTRRIQLRAAKTRRVASQPQIMPNTRPPA